MLLRFVLGFLVLLVAMVPVSHAQGNPGLLSPSITVNLPSRTIELFSGDCLVKEFPIAIGKTSTPTPLGTYSIICKEVNPAWYPPDRPGTVVPSGPDNPLGYRWMGIWKDYGIHGTNAPWSIGAAVSNGCIRMHEEDVEELFDKVNYGTPVRITYDRIKIRTNAQGQVTLAVYPDIYGYGSVTIQDIRNKLNAYRLNALVSDNVLRKLLDDPSDQQTVIANQFKIKLNGKLIGVRGLIVQGVPYVPLYDVGKVLNCDVRWDDKTRTARYGASSIPGIVSGDIAYIPADQLSGLFGGQVSWKTEENTLNFDKMMVLLNEKPVNIEINKIQGMYALPALKLAETMGYKAVWNQETKTLTVGEKGKAVTMTVDTIGTEPYIKITSINEAFGVHVYLNEAANSIELTNL